MQEVPNEKGKEQEAKPQENEGEERELQPDDKEA